MDSYDLETYGDRMAAVYDRLYPANDSVPVICALIDDLAEPGTVLELGVGTGRIALPLAQLGRQVVGVDSSNAMLDQLRAKQVGENVVVHLADFARGDLGGGYALAFVVFNTLFGLASQEDQVACFQNVARSLKPGGRFLVEAFVPDPSRFDRGQRTSTTSMGTDQVMLDVSIHDPVNQVIESTHIMMTPHGQTLFPVRTRYAWPAELDLMARLAGFKLENRWADWNRSPFGRNSTSHISVWALTK